MTRDEYMTSIINGMPSTYSTALPVRGPLKVLAGMVYDSLKPKGEATGAEIEALTDMSNGDAYKVITTGGAITAGSITVLVGDVVYYDEENSVWKFLVSGAAINA